MTNTIDAHQAKLRRFHISLRELLLLVAGVSLACAALKTANGAWWTILAALMLLITMAMGIVAVVDRGGRQAFAFGFLICVAIYAFLIVMNRKHDARYSREMDPYEGDLPTTKLTFHLFEAMVTRTATPINSPWPQPTLATPGGFIQPPPTTTLTEEPDRTTFMRVAHVFWALFLGYCGGRFAQVVYHRRNALDNRHPELLPLPPKKQPSPRDNHPAATTPDRL